jgi:transposase
MSINKGDTAIFMIDKDQLIEALLQERDEMYSELVQLRKIEQGALEHAEKKIERFETLVKEKDATIQKLND